MSRCPVCGTAAPEPCPATCGADESEPLMLAPPFPNEVIVDALAALMGVEGSDPFFASIGQAVDSYSRGFPLELSVAYAIPAEGARARGRRPQVGRDARTEYDRAKLRAMLRRFRDAGGM